MLCGWSSRSKGKSLTYFFIAFIYKNRAVGFLLLGFETDTYTPSTRYGTRRVRYTHSCGVRAFSLEHGGGPLGIVKVTGLRLQSIVDINPLYMLLLLSFRIFPS